MHFNMLLHGLLYASLPAPLPSGLVGSGRFYECIHLDLSICRQAAP